MGKRNLCRLVYAGLILAMLTGCGAFGQPNAVTEQSSAAEQNKVIEPPVSSEQPVLPAPSPDAQESVDSQSSDYITVAEAKEETLNNAGLSQEAVQVGDAQPDSGEQYIGNEAAKQAALSHAGLSEAEVRFVHARLEWDDGRWTYDVEFHKDNIEYEYDIDALTGEVLAFDYDAEYDQQADNAAQGGQITEERAKQIALEYAGVEEKDTRNLTIDFDYDDGRAEYEIEWDVGRTEYSCDVDADTGEILSFEKEMD